MLLPEAETRRLRAPIEFGSGHVSRSPKQRPNEQLIAQPIEERSGMSTEETILDRNESNTPAVSSGPELANLGGSKQTQDPVLAENFAPTIRPPMQDRSNSPSRDRNSDMASNDYDNLFQRHYHLQSQRNEAIETRIGVIEQRAALRQRISDYREAQGTFQVQLEAFSTDNAPPESIAPLLASIRHIQRSQDDLFRHIDHTKELEAQLNQLEYDFGKEENGFFGDLRTAIPSILKTAQMPDKASHPASESTISRGSGHRRVLLEKFYDKKSDIPVLEERLAELEDTFAYERAERETRADLGKPISPPDLEFYTQYNQDKETMQRELRRKRNEVARLEAECVQRDLLPGHPQMPDTGAQAGETAGEQVQKAQSWAHSPKSEANLEQSFLSDRHEIIPPFANPRERINTWLEEARSDEAGEPEMLAIEEDETREAQGTDPALGSGCETPLLQDLSRPLSSLDSWQDIEDSQLGQKRNISSSSTISPQFSSEQEPPQKSSKPS